jgi:hypothetical protein
VLVALQWNTQATLFETEMTAEFLPESDLTKYQVVERFTVDISSIVVRVAKTIDRKRRSSSTAALIRSSALGYCKGASARQHNGRFHCGPAKALLSQMRLPISVIRVGGHHRARCGAATPARMPRDRSKVLTK